MIESPCKTCDKLKQIGSLRCYETCQIIDRVQKVLLHEKNYVTTNKGYSLSDKLRILR